MAWTRTNGPGLLDTFPALPKNRYLAGGPMPHFLGRVGLARHIFRDTESCRSKILFCKQN
jgi:hypothetical protein